MRQTITDKIFKDKQGKLTLIQKPNLLILLWLFAVIVNKLDSNRISKFLSVLGFGLIFTWAWFELTEGVNYFRRVLGLIVLIVTIMGMTKG